MDLELEPGRPEPPPPRPAGTSDFVKSVRRARSEAAVRRARGRIPSPVRSAALSIVAHAAILGLLWLAWSLRPETRERPWTVTISLRDLVEAADPEAQAGGTADTAEAPQDEETGAKAERPGPLFEDEDATATLGAAAAPAGSEFLGRTAGRERLLVAGGGDDATEGAVRLALEWLANHQARDGSWSASGFGAACADGVCSFPGEAEYREAATALALLPFLGAGHSHRAGPWRDTVREGLRALVRMQHDDGGFGGDALRGYANGLATLALAEAYGLTGSGTLRGPAQRAADFLVRTQAASGGWRYVPGDGSADTSVTGWCTVALHAARKAGLRVPDSALGACRSWFAHVRNEQGEYGYLAPGGGRTALLGVGAFCRVLLGDPPDAAELAATFALLERKPPKLPTGPDDNAGEYGAADPVHWYYGALATFQRGGGTWTWWNERLREVLLRSQVRDATHARGSWPAMGATGRHGGRLVTTAFCALTLEVYYRYPRATLR